MANAKKCDLCGAFYIPRANAWRFKLVECGGLMDEFVDTCHECSFKLEKFVKEIKENNNAEN